jgi:hypothetical protein
MLRLADLEQSKNAVLHSLGAASPQESYRHAIDEFISWCCSEPRLSFNRTVVPCHRYFLEPNSLAPSTITINVRLAAVRRLASEASDTGLLSPHLAAGIRRVKGAKRLGVRIGNWLTVDQSKPSSGSRCHPAYEVNVIARFWPCSSAADCAGLNWSDSERKTPKSVKSTASLLTWLAEESTSAPFLFPWGETRRRSVDCGSRHERWGDLPSNKSTR